MEMKGIWRHIRIDRKKIYKTIVCSTVVAGLGALGPFMLGRLYDQSSFFTKEFLFASIFALCLVYLVKDYFEECVVQDKEEISFACEMRFRCLINNHLNRLPPEFYQENNIGGIEEKINRAANYMFYLINDVLFLVLPETLLSIAIFFALLKVNYLFSLIMFLMLAIHMVLTISISRDKIDSEKDRSNKTNKFASFAHNTRINLSAIKSLQMEDRINHEYGQLGNDVNLSVSLFLRKIFNKELLQKNILTLGTVASYGLFFFLSKEGKISTGDIIIVLSYTAMLIGPFSSLSRQYGMIRKSMVSINAANEILDELEEQYETGENIEAVKGDAINFSDVSYAPNKGSGETLKNVSMEIPSGPGLYAIVGESGSGKTTWWRIFLRFYSRYSGKIIFNGKDIREIKIFSLKKYVLSIERTVLFDKSIRFNAGAGNPDATEDDVKTALRAVRLGYLIDCDGGLDRIIGSIEQISHGEIMRILIARMLLNKDAMVLIFDEPTQALDSINAAKIMEILGRLSLTRKVIVITHDLKYIIGAKKIFVMEKGCMAEEGTFKELMDKNGKFAEHFNRQNKISKLLKDH